MSRRAVPVPLKLAPAAMLAGLLAACSASSTTGIAQAPMLARPEPSANLLQQVRASGRVGVELDVQPLRDPQVADLRTAATDAEGRGDYDTAREAVDKALQLAPTDPDLLQWRAELALVHRNFDEAARLAQRSYDTGPKSGGLCRRNQATLRLAAESRGDSALASQAQHLAAACKIAPPVRM